MKQSLLLALCLSASFAAAQTWTGLPTPPPFALVFNQIEQLPGWGSCNSPSCAGGSGLGTYWMAQNQSQPSLSGASTEIYNSGVGANALFYMKLGAHDNISNLLWDFYFQVDNNALSAAQALEFDSFQFINGYNYMIGSQCNVANGTWDTWDELHGHWIHTTIACRGFTPNTWHHIQWYVTTNHSAQTYHYVTLVVDGVPHPINQTYSAKDLNWGDNLGVQYQLDVNATGEGYHEWFDEVQLTVW
ncbi:MAG TPA: hypothetical protein VLV47_01085 [Candidatus Bathyarchaeia archaeon]|nr:hypothetical protein [Candidatus Bathyarchaeia archaeon]